MINLFKKWTIVKPSCLAPKTVVTRFRCSCHKERKKKCQAIVRV